MGVRGLTRFIAKNQENYFTNYKLRDSYIVIDAHSLCAQLYKFYTKSNDSFGGDYDKYSKCIESFFSMLQQCNVTPIVIFDGGYEKRKLKTVRDRLRNKIKIVRNANPVSLCGNTVFPLFIREVFRDIVLRLKIATARCDFEADFEIACIARNLNCPVLSFDSDFYIYGVLYIPFPTLDFHTTKINDDRGSNLFMACKIYNIDSFLQHFGGLDKSQLPLLATILGNDYIKKSVFKNFYAHLKLTRTKNGEKNIQQRTIIALLKWLRNETYDSAVRKILGRLKGNHRYRVARQIENITDGYICTDSEILKFLDLPGTEKSVVAKNKVAIDDENIQSESENEDFSEASNSSTDSDSEESNSGNEKYDLEELATITKSEEKILPEWFKIKYRKSEYPTFFMDLLSLNTCFYVPQVENTKNLQTVDISLPILRAIAKILLSNSSTYFVYLARNDHGRIRKYNVDISDLELPVLEDIESLNQEKRRVVLMSVLALTESDFQQILQLPNNWQLYYLALVYWAKNAVTPTVTFCHIYSIIVCLLHLDIVDKKAGYYRVKSTFMNKNESKLKTILANRKQTTNEIDYKIVSKDDCLFFIDSFVFNFALDVKMTANWRLYSLETVDAFAQFQSCLYYINHLNALLNYPIPICEISYFFNGTFLYNFCSNLQTRNDVDVYVELLLKNSQSILSIFKNTVSILKSILNLQNHVSIHKKRRRRKKKAEKSESEKSEENEDKSDDHDSDFDVNNKFSVLRLVK